MSSFLDYVVGSRKSLFVPPSILLYFDPETQNIAIADQGGTILPAGDWSQLRNMVDAFYSDMTDAEIDEINQDNRDRWASEAEDRESRPPKEKPGYVYMISDGKFSKVGRSQNPRTRLKDLQASGTAALELIHAVKCADPCEPEGYLHVRFHDRRVKGEWFDLSDSDIDWFKSQTPESLLELIKKGVPHERITSWQGLAKQLRRDFEAAGGVSR